MKPFSVGSLTLLQDEEKTSIGMDARSSLLFRADPLLPAVAEIINRYQISVPQIRVVGGLPKPAGEYFRWTPGRARRMQSDLSTQSLRSIITDLSCSVIVNRWDRYDPAIWAACNDIAARYCCEVVGNLYLSAQGSRSFGRHWDDHDVLVLHVAGVKTWHLFEEKVIPPVAGATFATPAGPPTTSICLQPGDALYVPAGQWHDVETTSADVSAHISIGLFPVTVADLLREQIGVLAASEPYLSEPVERAGEQAKAVQQALTELLASASRFGAMAHKPTP